MTAINLPSLSFNIDESSDKETLNNILDTLQLYRKELNFLLMNLDGDNMPSVIGRIEDAEGNVSNIVQTIDEISMTVASSAGDISNLQIKADQISVKVANAQGDIADLEITSQGISSTVASHTGQISQINQTAAGIQTQVSNQAGQISIINQTAAGIQTQVTNNKNSISSVSQTANSIQSQVTSLNGTVGAHSSQITQLGNSISSKVSYADYTGREIASLINQDAHRITISAEALDLRGVTSIYGDSNSIATFDVYGDFYIRHGSSIIFKVYNDIGAMTLSSFGQELFRYNAYTRRLFALGTWDFSSANVIGL